MRYIAMTHQIAKERRKHRKDADRKTVGPRRGTRVQPTPEKSPRNRRQVQLTGEEMSRIRTVDKLDFLPKKCVVTGRGGEGPFVDFGPDVTYMGNDPHNVYIRHDFVEKGGKAIGMLSASEAKELQEERAELIAENAELRREAKANVLHARAEAAKLAYAGASAAVRSDPRTQP
jgi:hypothetical protein